VRLAAVEIIAGLFNSPVIGLFLNTVPSMVAVDANGPGATCWTRRGSSATTERKLAEPAYAADASVPVPLVIAH
jgi:hypothetical protein